jgi:hypothetical protein
MSKKYHRAIECREEIHSAKDETFEKGWYCGWECGDDFLSFKEGYTTYLYSHPHQGKTVFVIETLIHLAKNEGKVTCIYSPETGGKKEMFWNLIQVYTGKRMYGMAAHRITPKEIDEAIAFINKHFIVIEHDPFASGKMERFTVKDIFNQVYLAEQEYKLKVNVLCIDPFNLLDRELEDDRKAIQDYVLGTLSFINSASRKMKMHTILVAHLSGEDIIVDKDTGIEYMPKPHPSKLAGGQSFWRAGFQMVGIWREPYGIIDRSGMPYQENCMQVLVQKTKPFGVGKLGVFKVFYDTDTHTLYETGRKNYRCGEMRKEGLASINYTGKNTSLKPSVKWDEPMKNLDDHSTPF